MTRFRLAAVFISVIGLLVIITLLSSRREPLDQLRPLAIGGKISTILSGVDPVHELTHFRIEEESPGETLRLFRQGYAEEHGWNWSSSTTSQPFPRTTYQIKRDSGEYVMLIVWDVHSTVYVERFRVVSKEELWRREVLERVGLRPKRPQGRLR